jgi:hypothetical protein
MVLKIIIHIFIIFCFSNVCAQSCQGFYKTSRCAIKNSSGFKQYGQARSAAVEVGKKYSYSAILYGRKDYIFNVCSEAGYKNIHYKIKNKTTGELIYDNEEENYNNAVAFSIEKTSNIEIEVEILYDKEKGIDPEKYRVCLGVQILWRKIPNLGF